MKKDDQNTNHKPDTQIEVSKDFGFESKLKAPAYSEKNEYVPEIDSSYIFDPETNSWSDGPPLPKGHSHAEGATFVHDNKIWMIGGHTTPMGGSKAQDPDILTLAPGSQWQKVGELPNPLSSPAAGIINGIMYIGGGAYQGSTVQSKMWMAPVP